MRALIVPLLFLLACQTTPASKSPGQGPQALTQRPGTTLPEYTKVFRQLPLAASVTRLPWTSDSWTTLQGGAGFRWQLALEEQIEELEELEPFVHYPIGAPLNPAQLSPVEKLDLYLGNQNWELTRKERLRTLEQKNADGTPREDIPEWEGIMHAWSIASLQFDPIAPVTISGQSATPITFETHDIYSLLSLFVHEQSPKPLVLASPCVTDDIGAAAAPYAFENEKQKLRSKNCGPIDAARFHLVLANQIGKLNEGFIMDRDFEGEIANNPVVAYESRLMEKPGVTVKPNESRTVHVRTVVFLTAVTPVNTLDVEEEAYPYETEAYEYELTIDPKGEISGGRWIAGPSSDANQAIPDFLWKASPVWLNGPIKTVYERARQALVDSKAPKQLRPLEDMPIDERQALNQYFNQTGNIQ